jgi:hypothetical protein
MSSSYAGVEPLKSPMNETVVKRTNRKVSLDDKYALDTTRAYMTGIEALVRLPMLQHQRDLERGINTAGSIKRCGKRPTT